MNHVAFVIPSLDRLGGAERQVLMLASGLRRREWQVSVVALTANGATAAAELHATGISFVSLGMRKGLADPRGWVRLQRWIKAQQPDILHAHLPHAAWISRWSRIAAPMRVVIDTVHTSATGPVSRRLGYRTSHWLTDTATFVSRDALNAWTASGVVPHARTAAVRNAVDTALFYPDPNLRATMRSRLGLGNEFLWFTAGRFDPVKNYPMLLAAMQKLPPHAHLLIAGTGPERANQKILARSLGLQDRVRFIGFVHEVHRWMQAADAVVLASRWEGLPLVLLEAGACALPSVATNVPGSREVLQHGRTGLLTTPDDPVALASAMSDLMQMPAEMRAKLGSQARHHILAHFSLDAILDRWHDVYTGLLTASPTPRRWAIAGKLIPEPPRPDASNHPANAVPESFPLPQTPPAARLSGAASAENPVVHVQST